MPFSVSGVFSPQNGVTPCTLDGRPVEQIANVNASHFAYGIQVPVCKGAAEMMTPKTPPCTGFDMYRFQREVDLAYRMA